MMEAARTSETFENFYQTTRRYNPEDSHPNTRRRENLKSYLISLRPCEIQVKDQRILFLCRYTGSGLIRTTN
jgi:hypothetical protein